jgi:hypothetical protein
MQLIPQEAIERLDWVANLAYFKGYGLYQDAAARAVVEYFAPALAYADWPEDRRLAVRQPREICVGHERAGEGALGEESGSREAAED